MPAANAAPAPYMLLRQHGGESPAGTSDLQRMVSQSGLPRVARAVLMDLIRIADWATWTLEAPLSWFDGGYSRRHARRGLRMLEDLELVDTHGRAWMCSQYAINVARLHKLATAMIESAALLLARKHKARERAAEKERSEPLMLAHVAGTVRAVLGTKRSDLAGWSTRRCERLHRNIGSPSLVEWRKSWEVVRTAMDRPETMPEGMARIVLEGPGTHIPRWLWRGGEFNQAVARIRVEAESRELADFEREHLLALLAEKHPAGDLYRFGTLQAWEGVGPARSPRHGGVLLHEIPELWPLLEAAAVRWDGAHLVLAFADPERLDSALEFIDPAVLEAYCPGPIALTWTNR